MDATRSDFMQRLLSWSTVIVLWHSVAVVWHLYLVPRLQINFPQIGNSAIDEHPSRQRNCGRLRKGPRKSP